MTNKQKKNIGGIKMRYLFPLSQYNAQRQFEKPVWVYPAHIAAYATHLRNEGHDVLWDSDREYGDLDQNPIMIMSDEQIDIKFEDLPFPDREFTGALDKRWQSYGNYKFHPATHMMASNLCWYGKCTFCIDTEKLKTEGRGLRSVDHCIEEIMDCHRLGIKEIFDDSGTFPIGKWLDEFCLKMVRNDLHKKIIMGCNMKPLKKVDYKMMANTGFRFILVGIESANQETIDKIRKGQDASAVIEVLERMSEAGLEPHGTFMTGYPWENPSDEQRTINLCYFLLKKGYLKTAQASVYSPPRTAPDPDSIGHKYLPRFYDIYRSPTFLLRKVRDIKKWEDFTYIMRGARLVMEEKWRKMFV